MKLLAIRPSSELLVFGEGYVSDPVITMSFSAAIVSGWASMPDT